MFQPTMPINLKFYKGHINKDFLNYKQYLKTDEELKELRINSNLPIINETSSDIQLLHTINTAEWGKSNGCESVFTDSDYKDSKE